ncbi:hypothetical protein [Aporhodopirellula aestuarii]|uniref:Uncharacterized protein n=1 Tax=Aporhodopirellula aestuarii TaxID=2950107 RepID=A0ABT0U5B9_9BACT|nr:hypothetical protein [Aporhodopirellula aestuarii]MCM2372121.1 hypothetical protein [Aporhodopirellula aestuarii]
MKAINEEFPDQEAVKSKRAKRWRLVLLFGAVAAIVAGFGGWLAVYYVGATALSHVPLEPGNVAVPTLRTLQWRDRSETTDQLTEYWAKRPLKSWQTEGKINAARALLGRFLLQRDLDAANAYLLSVEPWGAAGSTWFRHPEGDYDFTMAGLTPILFLFGDQPDVLYPDTREHLLDVLLPLEGGEPLVMVPRTFGLIRDTENHLLMTEGSRYLKNRWMALHGSTRPEHDNVANSLEAWLLKLLDDLRSAGVYEFNSIPYEGYTLTALLNLEAFGSDAVRESARDLLDQLNWNYALGSLRFRRFPPFRRQLEHADDAGLSSDRHTALIKTWISLLPDGPTDLKITENQHIGIWGCWAPYRFPDQTARWIIEKPTSYYVQIGHGPSGSPEIYSGGPGYLLTAGGVHRGARSMLVARPITLILDDKAKNLSQVLHLSGPGTDFRQWNCTGVWRDFAVAAGPVSIPKGWKPDAASETWQVYQRGESLCVAVHSTNQVGIVCLVHGGDPQAALTAIETANPDVDRLKKSFRHPGGNRIDYDTGAPQSRWVIERVDGEAVDRRFDSWPRLRGDVPSQSNAALPKGQGG